MSDPWQKRLERRGKKVVFSVLRRLFSLSQEELPGRLRPSRILWIRQDRRLGNLLLTLPALEAVKRAAPETRTALLVSAEFSSLVENDPRVDELFVFDGKRILRRPWRLFGLLRRLRQGRYELAVDCASSNSASLSNGLWTRLSGAWWKLGYRRENSECFLNHRLGYTDSRGSPSLRREITRVYETIDPDQVLVHTGAEEAIFLFFQAVLQPGDHIIVHWPCYQSLFQVAESIGCEITRWEAREQQGWALDLDELRRLLRPDTRVIVVNLPHNPTGYLMREQSYRALHDLARERGILLFSDEVLTGMGRTGKWFGFEYYDIVPDILTTSKALGQGVPVAAVITTDEIAEKAVAKGFDQGATHMGDSFQCAVALANIEVIEKENLLEKSSKMGALLKKGLKELQTRFEVIGDVRGKGLFMGLEIVESRSSKQPDADRALKLVTKCEDRGLLLGGGIPTGGLGTNTIRLCPPLVITEEQIATAIDIIKEVLPEI